MNNLTEGWLQSRYVSNTVLYLLKERDKRVLYNLENKFVEVLTEEGSLNAFKFFEVYGIDTATMRKNLFIEGRVFLGIKNGVPNAYKITEIINSNPYLITLKTFNIEELREPERPNEQKKIVYCETPEMAIYLDIVLDKVGRTWSSGNRYTHEKGMHFMGSNLVGETEEIGKYYDITEGRHGTRDCYDNPSHLIINAAELFFGFKESLLKEIPKDFSGSIPREELVPNRIYVAERETNFFMDFRELVFKLAGKNSDFCGVITPNSFTKYRMVEKDTLINSYIREATEEEKIEFRKIKREDDRAERESRLYSHQRRLKEKERRKRERQELNLLNYNKDIKTQLLSSSLHGMLYKRLDSKVARTLLKLNNLGYMLGVTRNITIRKSDGEMTYTPSNKETELTENDKWQSKGRQSSKYGKLIRKVLAEQVPRMKFKDSEIEYLVNHLKAEADNGEFSIVSGTQIQDWYDGDNYADDDKTGTLGCSCMRHNTEYMELYAKNPDVCKMVILVKDGSLHGRALLWEDKWMDRIYGSDATIRAFKNFAVKEGYNCKTEQNSNNTDEWINPEGDVFNETFKIHLETSCDYYPYADTFYFINTLEGWISNRYSTNYTGELRSTDGYIDEENTVWDEIDGRNIHEDDAVWMDYREEYTHSDNAVYCDIENEYFLTDDMVALNNGRYVYREASGVIYVETSDEYALENDVYFCEQSSEYYIEDHETRVYLEELEITVAECNVAEAYEENGYHYQNDEWVKKEEEK